MKILIVDDLPETRILLKSLIKSFNYEVFQASDGLEAMKIIDSEEIDIVLSDWLMPAMDGIEFCREIRKKETEKYIYFILLTSKNDKNDLITGMEAGADDFLQKPFNSQELKVRIRAGERIIALHNEMKKKNNTLSDYSRQMEKDLKAASELQQSLLPDRIWNIGELSFEAIFYPSKFLSGYIFNYFLMDDDHIGFYLVDVVGHGAASAILSVGLYNDLIPWRDNQKNNILFDLTKEVPLPKSPADVLWELNNKFLEKALSMHYYTLVYGIIDITSYKVKICSASQPFPLFFKNNGEVEKLEIENFPVGIFENAEFDEREITILPNESLVLYSDGLLEFFEESGKFSRNLIEIFYENINTSISLEQIFDISNERKFTDDFSLIRITRLK